MKKEGSFLLLVWLVISLPAMAFSDTVKPRVPIMDQLKRSYGEVSFGGGYGGGIIGLGGGVVSKKSNWGIHYFGYLNFSRSNNRPTDFIPASNWLYSNAKYPRDHSLAASVAIVKDFTTKNKKLRIAISAGPTYTSYDTKIFESQQNVLGAYFGNSGNYKVSSVQSHAIGLALKASVGYMSINKFGQQLSLLANYNEKQVYAGLQLDLLFGKLWERPKKPKKVKVVKPKIAVTGN